MSKEDKKEKKNKKECKRRKGIMLAFGLTTISTRVVSALSLAAIAFSVCSMKKEANLFNNCVEEITEAGQSTPEAVKFCYGG